MFFPFKHKTNVLFIFFYLKSTVYKEQTLVFIIFRCFFTFFFSFFLFFNVLTHAFISFAFFLKILRLCNLYNVSVRLNISHIWKILLRDILYRRPWQNGGISPSEAAALLRKGIVSCILLAEMSIYLLRMHLILKYFMRWWAACR